MDDFYSFIKSLWVVWMMVLFVGIVIWVFLPRNRGRFRQAAEIPLDDDELQAPTGTKNNAN
jgi:cbb3-type cytochrome oxidase subunit 3